MIAPGDFHTLKHRIENRAARLVAVSKTHPVSAIETLYAWGQRDFGENRPQELADKQPQLPKDIRWHFIGHLQRNKVKLIAPFVHLIHAVDSLRLLVEIDKRAQNHERTIDCLLQLHIAEEESKFGLDEAQTLELLDEWSALQTQRLADLRKSDTPPTGARVVGLMGMATYTSDRAQISREFERLQSFFDQLKQSRFAGVAHFDQLSMGMSGDYDLALDAGSTLVRIGSKLFGQRA